MTNTKDSEMLSAELGKPLLNRDRCIVVMLLHTRLPLSYRNDLQWDDDTTHLHECKARLCPRSYHKKRWTYPRPGK